MVVWKYFGRLLHVFSGILLWESIVNPNPYSWIAFWTSLLAWLAGGMVLERSGR